MTKLKLIAAAIAIALAACGDDVAPGPDADVPLCSDVGCPDAALCNAEGLCSCLASGEPVTCRLGDEE